MKSVRQASSEMKETEPQQDDLFIAAELQDLLRTYYSQDQPAPDASQRVTLSSEPGSAPNSSARSPAAVTHVVGSEQGTKPLDEKGTPPDEWEAKVSDLRAFAERVYYAFRKSRRPFREASRYELNAFARASFMLGEVDNGLRIFKLMLGRRFVPDLHDVNVALSLLSDYNPSAAALVIERMVGAGLQPDAVTFGSVIHQAIVHGDTPLAMALMRRARELNVPRLSYKTIGTLIHAIVTRTEDGRVSAEAVLDTAKELVGVLLDAREVPSPNMGRDCVIAAMRADDPRAAFKFWSTLMKDKMEWEDEAHAATRRKIAVGVRRHQARGWLADDRARVMLAELGEPSGRGSGMRKGAAGR